jgi:hypothetical protein
MPSAAAASGALVDDVDYKIRPADFQARGELHWIVKSWLACDRSTLPARREGPTYTHRQRARIDAILAGPETSTLVAENAHDGRLDGFSVTEPGVLHYVYVRLALHRVGLARRLCSGLGDGTVYTHLPADPRVRIPPTWVYDASRRYPKPLPPKDLPPCA